MKFTHATRFNINTLYIVLREEKERIKTFFITLFGYGLLFLVGAAMGLAALEII